MTRNELADELLNGGIDASALTDHHAIARAIRDGRPLDRIRNMPELERWPSTAEWLDSHWSDIEQLEPRTAPESTAWFLD